MPHDRLERVLAGRVKELAAGGLAKGAETVITGIVAPGHGRGPRYLIEGEGERPFLRMNANNYLGLTLDASLAVAEEEAVAALGTGPGAVRFISGTFRPHIELEERLARFHGRDAAMIWSSAYAAVMGVLPPLITAGTAVISDALNHNSIINAIALARPAEKRIYPHLDLDALDAQLAETAKTCRRAIVVTDGIFSMRGDHAPLAEISEIVRRHDPAFAENVLLVVDDSHGVAAFGTTGRGTEEFCGARADILIATLGKAFGVNGGYAVASAEVIAFLRETSPFYIYSNPVTPGEAAAAKAAIDLVDGPKGRALLDHLRAMTARFTAGLVRLGLETIAGEHPVVPLVLRDTERTRSCVRHLKDHAILATGLAYPVVPRGDEEIRFQVSADHTPADIDEAGDVLASFVG